MDYSTYSVDSHAHTHTSHHAHSHVLLSPEFPSATCPSMPHPTPLHVIKTAGYEARDLDSFYLDQPSAPLAVAVPPSDYHAHQTFEPAAQAGQEHYYSPEYSSAASADSPVLYESESASHSGYESLSPPSSASPAPEFGDLLPQLQAFEYSAAHLQTAYMPQPAMVPVHQIPVVPTSGLTSAPLTGSVPSGASSTASTGAGSDSQKSRRGKKHSRRSSESSSDDSSDSDSPSESESESRQSKKSKHSNAAAVSASGLRCPSSAFPPAAQCTPEELKLRKLARKAELARLSRKRKKCRLTDLEAQVAELQAELDRVKKTAAEQVEAANDRANEANAAAQIRSMANGFPAGASPSGSSAAAFGGKNIHEWINEFLHHHHSGWESKELARDVDQILRIQEHHVSKAMEQLNGLNELLIPAMPLQFLTWIMNQSDPVHVAELIPAVKIENGMADIHAAPVSASSSSAAAAAADAFQALWNDVWQRELQLTPAQFQEIYSLRTTIKKQHKFQIETMKAHRKLHGVLLKHLKQNSENLDRLRAILTEQQMAKFFQYGISNHGEWKLPINIAM